MNKYLITSCFSFFFTHLIYAAPCQVESVSENAYLFDSASYTVATPDDQWLVVVDDAARNLKIIETATQQVLTTLSLNGLEPGGLSFSLDGHTLYVTGAFDGNVQTFDTSAADPTQWVMKESWKISGDFGKPLLYQVTDNEAQLLVLDRTVQGVRVLSAQDGHEIAKLTSPNCDLPVNLTRDREKLFVACETSNRIAVFNLTDFSYTKDISVGNSPSSLLLHPTLSRLYVTNSRSASISVIDTETLERTTDLESKMLISPVDMLWMDKQIWILDRDNKALVRFEPKTQTFKSGICNVSGRVSSSSHLLLSTITTAQGKEKVVYVTHSDGVDYLSINVLYKRLSPQVIMSGFDPILLDVKDTKFSVLAVVEEGTLALDSLSLEQNNGGLKIVMQPIGTIPLVVEENRKIQGIVYETVFEIPDGLPAGTVATEVLGLPSLSLFGELAGQFRVQAKDKAGQKHAYPDWSFGDWELQEKSEESETTFLNNYTKIGVKRVAPQIIMAGFSPMLMDRVDTELKILAVVRPGVAEIDHVSLRLKDGSFFSAMQKVTTLPNNDVLYSGIVVNQTRGNPLFKADTNFSNLWNDLFRIEVTDKAQQKHQFPDFRVGQYPAF